MGYSLNKQAKTHFQVKIFLGEKSIKGIFKVGIEQDDWFGRKPLSPSNNPGAAQTPGFLRRPSPVNPQFWAPFSKDAHAFVRAPLFGAETQSGH
jgi:hypothetical protein